MMNFREAREKILRIYPDFTLEQANQLAYRLQDKAAEILGIDNNAVEFAFDPQKNAEVNALAFESLEKFPTQ